MDVLALPIPTPRQLRAIRAWVGVRQPDFASRASISVAALADYELGRRQTSENVLLAIALQVSKMAVRFEDGRLVLDA